MKKKMNIRILILIIFLVTICCMGYGFAKYNKNVGFSGNVHLSALGKLYISNIQKIDQEFINASGVVQSFSDSNAVLPVTATDVVFTATYLVTVTNTFPYDVVFSGISIVPHVVSGEGTVDHYVELSNNADGSRFYPGSEIDKDSDTVLKMKIYYTSDSVVSISTDIGVVVIPESHATTGSLSKGNINKTTGSFNDDKVPECYSVNFINSYSYENVVGITLNNANYKVVKPNGNPFGNVEIPANSEKNVEYCIVPVGDLTTRHDNVNVNYLSYSSGESFSDSLSFDVVTLVRTLTLKTNMNDGLILCNNVSTGVYNILDTPSGSAYKQATAKVKIGDTIECSFGDGDSEKDTKNEYLDGNTLVNYKYQKWTIADDEASLNISVPLICRYCPSGNCQPCNYGAFNYNQDLNPNDKHTVATTGTYTVPKTGYYLVELWGGSGGHGYNWSKNLGALGGSYGYTYGLVYLNQNQVLYYTLGGDGCNGSDNKGVVGAGGANGGGVAGCDDCNFNAGGGGGWSAVFNASTTGDLLMLSAGGGAGSGPGGLTGAQKGGKGGDGATVLNAISNYTAWTSTNSQGTIIFGANGSTDSSKKSYGIAGTNQVGYCIFNSTRAKEIGTAFVVGNANHAGSGGSSEYHAAPGGGGYFGGGGAVQIDASSTIAKNGRYPGGGAGGSSFIANSITFQNLSSLSKYNLLTTRPGSNGGAFRISFLFDTLDGVN